MSQENTIFYYLNDPSKRGFVENVPVPADPPWKLKVRNYKGAGQDKASMAGLAANCYVTLANTLNYIVPRIPDAPKRWAAVHELLVWPRAGKNLNAYYDRRNLKFFYAKDPMTGKVIFTSQSADIVSHELGHAVLDAFRPDLFSVQGLEGWAFHESFGDMMAVIASLQWDQVLDYAVQLDLNKSNMVSRLAEEMASTVYHMSDPKMGYRVDALRDASNQFIYQHPERLPKATPDHMLSNEPHNFSRVFTGGWYEMLVRIYEQHVKDGMPKKEALIAARDVSCDLILHAAKQAPRTVRLYDAVAKYMLLTDKQNGGKYQDIIQGVFGDRKILRPRILMMNADLKAQDLNGDHIVHACGESVIVRNNASIKLSDQLGIMALSNNPLYNVSVEVPSEERYEFNEHGYLVEAIVPERDEILTDVQRCLDFLNEQDLVGLDDHQPFEVHKNKLVRTQFYGCMKCSQRAVHRQNACDPQAPEYGKPHKPANNAGCCCKGENWDCECDDTPPSPPPKLGCYTRVTKAGNNAVKVCSRVSRTVC